MSREKSASQHERSFGVKGYSEEVNEAIILVDGAVDLLSSSSSAKERGSSFNLISFFLSKEICFFGRVLLRKIPRSVVDLEFFRGRRGRFFEDAQDFFFADEEIVLAVHFDLVAAIFAEHDVIADLDGGGDERAIGSTLTFSDRNHFSFIQLLHR